MNFIDHLASTCGLKVRSYGGGGATGIVPGIIIEATGWGKLIQTLLDHHAELDEIPSGYMRMRQFMQHLRHAPLGNSEIVVYPQWFPMVADEGESLHAEDLNDCGACEES